MENNWTNCRIRSIFSLYSLLGDIKSNINVPFLISIKRPFAFSMSTYDKRCQTAVVVVFIMNISYNSFMLLFIIALFFRIYIYMNKKFMLPNYSCCFSWLEINSIIQYYTSLCCVLNDTFFINIRSTFLR